MFDPIALGIPPQTSISIAWIDLDEEEAKHRMQKRADPRDDWKLAHWEQYAPRRVNPPTHPTITRFDNAQFDEAQFDQLIDALTRQTPSQK